MNFYILTGTLDSVLNANYAALFPELFPNDVVRAKTNALRQAFMLVGMIISIALTPVVTDMLGYGLTAILYGLLGGGVILYMTFTCRERDPEPEEAKPGLWKAVKEMCRCLGLAGEEVHPDAGLAGGPGHPGSDLRPALFRQLAGYVHQPQPLGSLLLVHTSVT